MDDWIGSVGEIQHPMDDWIGSVGPKSIGCQPMHTPSFSSHSRLNSQSHHPATLQPTLGLFSSEFLLTGLLGGAGLYTASNTLYNVEGGHRAIIFNHLVGVKDKWKFVPVTSTKYN